MAVDPYIARGINSPGAGVAQAWAVGQNLAEDRRRGDLAQQRIALEQQQEGRYAQKDASAQADIERQRKAQFLITQLRTPNGRAQAVAMARQNHPQETQGSTDEEIAGGMEQYLQLESGVKPGEADVPYDVQFKEGPFGTQIAYDNNGKFDVV